MAYSSIGHMGLRWWPCGGTAEGAQACWSIISYVAMTARQLRRHPDHEAQRPALRNISDFSGLSRTNPLLAFFFAMLLVFRWRVFRRWPASSRNSTCSSPRSRPGCSRLSVIGVLTSVVGAYYYLLIVKVMYFDEPLAQLDRCAWNCARCWRSRASSTSSSSSIRGAGQRGNGRGEVTVLNGLCARSAGHLGGLPARGVRSYRLDQCGSHGARPRRRARPIWFVTVRTNRGTRPAASPLDRAAW